MSTSFKAGVIDIGTNTVLCVKAEIGRENIDIVSDNRFHYRAGQRLDAAGNISPEYKKGMERAVLSALEVLSGCTEIKIVATEVLRKPKDGALFAAALSDKTGYPVEIISPREEARLGFIGAAYGHGESPGMIGVLDVGGGSTELAVGEDDRFLDWKSIPIGAVSLAEKVGYEEPLTVYLQAADKAFAESGFADLTGRLEGKAIAAGGSAVASAAILAGLSEYEPEIIGNFYIIESEFARLLEKLSSIDISRRRAMMVFDTPRADIIVPGGAILLSFMRNFGLERLKVSTNGLRHGLLLELFSQLEA